VIVSQGIKIAAHGESLTEGGDCESWSPARLIVPVTSVVEVKVAGHIVEVIIVGYVAAGVVIPMAGVVPNRCVVVSVSTMS
jgi:hypothetical protein